MPIQSNDYFQPTSTSQPFLMDDQFLQGGYKVVLDLDARDYLLNNPEGLKVGMLVYVLSEKKFFQLDGEQLTKPFWDIPTFIESGFTHFDAFQVNNPQWVEAKFGGGPIETVAFPFLVEDGVLKMDPSVAIPPGGQPGQFLVPNVGGELEWIDAPSFGLKRGVQSFTCPMTLNQGDTLDFSLPMAKSVMLLAVSLSTQDIKIEGFNNPLRDEKNPYTFISHIDFMTDEGVTVKDDGSYVNHRRHSFLANLEDPATSTLFFRFTNIGQAASSPTVGIQYLILEE